MYRLEKQSYNMAHILRDGAKDIKSPSYVHDMADWWTHQATLHKKLGDIREANFFLKLLTFPYWIYKEMKVFTEISDWSEQFDLILDRYHPESKNG